MSGLTRRRQPKGLKGGEGGPQQYTPLAKAVEGWLHKPLKALPRVLRRRVEEEFFPIAWDMLSAEQRQVAAIHYDIQHDPRYELERQVGFDRGAKRIDLQRQIDIWNTVAVTNVAEASEKEDRLQELHAELRRLTPQRDRPKRSSSPPEGYVAYPKAAAALAERLAATPEEIAAWVRNGPEQGGLAAHRDVYEFSPPPRFFFDPLLHPDGDFLAPLAECWFAKADVERFVPSERFVTGAALLAAWAARAGNARTFIAAKIRESRLSCIHPIFGGTREVFGDDAFPPLEEGLFARSEIERVDAEDLPATGNASSLSERAPIPSPAKGVGLARQAHRDAEIRARYAELAQAGNRNYVKEIQRTVAGAELLSDRRIRDIAKGR